MRQGLQWRLIVIFMAVALSVVYLLPGLPATQGTFLQKILPDAKVNLGLDLVGGMHLTLGVDVDKAIENSLAQSGQELRTVGREKGIIVLNPRPIAGERIEFTLAKAEQRDALAKFVSEFFPQLELSPPQQAGSGQLRYTANLRARDRAEMARMALNQALTTIRNRIDQFGVSEPDIRSQPDDNRIIIQLPGIKDPQRAIRIVGQTAHLEFHLVRDDVAPDRIARGLLPPNTKLLPQQGREGLPDQNLLVDSEAVLTGEFIENAAPSIDQRDNRPYVSLTFNNRGAVLFGV
jgi:preprotein translocase subunit SecD